MAHMKRGMPVSWWQGREELSGRIRHIYNDSVSRSLLEAGGHHGTDEDPALLIRTEDGGHVLKQSSEVRLEG